MTYYGISSRIIKKIIMEDLSDMELLDKIKDEMSDYLNSDEFKSRFAIKEDIEENYYNKVKVNELLDGLCNKVKSDIIGTAKEDFDTLGEIADWIEKHPDLYNALVEQVSKKVNKDEYLEKIKKLDDKDISLSNEINDFKGKFIGLQTDVKLLETKESYDIKGVQGQIDILSDTSSSNKTDLEGKITGVQSRIGELETKQSYDIKGVQGQIAQTKKEILGSDELSETLDTISEIGSWIKGHQAEYNSIVELQSKGVQGVQSQFTSITNDIKKDVTSLQETSATKTELKSVSDKVDTLEGTVSTNKTELEGKINGAQTRISTFETKHNIEIKGVQGQITTLECTVSSNKTDLEDNITGIQTRIGELEDKHNNDITNIKSQIKDVNMLDIEEPSSYDIPCIFLIGDEFSNLTTQKNTVNMRMMYVSKTKTFRSNITIKFQGESTLNYPKKNFTIKLFSDDERTIKQKVKFKNWPSYNKYILKANWIDITQSRNVVCAKIWSNVVKDRDDYDTLPIELTSTPNNGVIDGFMVKVYVNGVYYGRYNLNYGKDDIMFGENCKAAICSENYISGCFQAKSDFIKDKDWTIEYPDVDKLTTSNDTENLQILETAKTKFNKIIELCMSGDKTEFKNNIGNYVDVKSIIDYELFGRVSTHLDGFGKNQMFLYYGDKWYANVYDLDSTFGLYWTGTKIVSDTYNFQSEYETGVNKTTNLLYDLLDETFVDEIYARYKVLRKSSLSEESMISEFEKFMSICPSELVQEDYATTTAGGKFTNIPSKTITNIQQIRDNIVKRCAYCDKVIEEMYENEHTTKVYLSSKFNKVFGNVVLTSSNNGIIYYTLDGSTPTKNSQLYERPVRLTEGQTLNAIAFKGDYQSDIVTQSYETTYSLDKLYELDYTEIRKESNNYINTGVKLYETDKQFQILLDVNVNKEYLKYDGNTVYTVPFLACLKENSPYTGLICGGLTYVGKYLVQVVADKDYKYSLDNITSNNLNIKYIVTYICNNIYEIITYINNKKQTYSTQQQHSFETFDLPCLLGATWKGSTIDEGIMRNVDVNINSCMILSTPIEDTEIIKEAFNWEIQ